MYYVKIYYKDGWLLEGKSEKVFNFKDLDAYEDYKNYLTFLNETFVAWDE